MFASGCSQPRLAAIQLPNTIGDYMATLGWTNNVSTGHPVFEDAMNSVETRIHGLCNIRGKKTTDEYHRELGQVLWDYCGMSRSEQ